MEPSRDYIILPSYARYRLYSTISDPYNERSVRSYDEKLHQVLIKFAHKHRLTSGQIKIFIRLMSENQADKDCIFKVISRQERSLSKLLLKRPKLSLLWIAVLSGYQDSAELLVRSGADLNEHYGLPGEPGGLTKKSTILHALIRMYPSAWNERFIEMVLNHGADVKARESGGKTALHVAVDCGRVKVVKMLLERGADVNAVGIVGKTPVLDAARTNEADKLLPLLMSYGADINAKDIRGHNILRYLVCSEKEHVDLVKFIIEKGISPREAVLNEHHSIHVAVMRDSIELVSLLLDHGTDVNMPGFRGESPLHVAVQLPKNPEMLLTLLKRGANVGLKTIHGKTPLHEFAIHRSFSKGDARTVEDLKILLHFGADVFAKDNDGTTVLDLICREENLDNRGVKEILKSLALKGALLQPSTKFRGERIIEEKYPKLWDHYQPCIEEINRIKSTKFIDNCTMFELLTKCQCGVTELMRHRKFQRSFRKFDLSVFPVYSENLLENFNRAERYYKTTMDQEILIDDSTGKILPYNVARKIAQFTLSCEVCEMQKMVQSSRGILR